MTNWKGGWNLPVLGLAVLLGSSLAPALADVPSSKTVAEIVQELMHKELTGVPGKELRMLTVNTRPAAARLRIVTTPKYLSMCSRARYVCRSRARLS